MPGRRRSDPASRFWPKVEKGAGCWEWRGYRVATGYGQFYMDGGPVFAHRVAFMLAKGPIPEGMDVCHSCDNPSCVNPAHLWVGTRSENMRDCVAKGRLALNAPRGEKSPSARLTEREVAAIRSMEGSMTQREIGARFGVAQCTVSAILRGRIWAQPSDRAGA